VTGIEEGEREIKVVDVGTKVTCVGRGEDKLGTT
jgi:hypothetical protein